MMVTIVIHNYDIVNEVIPGVNSMTIQRAYDNRIIWADGDICAPFFVLPADIEFKPGTPVGDIQDKDISNSLDLTSQYMRLLKRVEELEKEREET